MGRKLEFEALNGYIVRKGREVGIHTPYNAMLSRELAALNLSRN
jgi:ketopantoate reductase